jgi:hypothetical protein
MKFMLKPIFKKEFFLLLLTPSFRSQINNSGWWLTVAVILATWRLRLRRLLFETPSQPIAGCNGMCLPSQDMRR